MSQSPKDQSAILAKLGISTLNQMQLDAIDTITKHSSTILLSPTGTGKTLAFLLPIISSLKIDAEGTQAIIITPSRELAIQIEQVARDMGTGYKINVVYGGRSIKKDRIELAQAPAILIGTPGRLLDHLYQETVPTEGVHTLVLDEFDKSLEIGFEEEMTEIISFLPQITKKVLTSATHEVEIPSFVELQDPVTIDYSDAGIKQLTIKSIVSPDKDKLETLVKALQHLGDQPGIIFCNYKDSIQRVSDYLEEHNISHGCFYGGLEQKDRERALIKFRNGTHQILLATDLAARGIDVRDLKFIIHYHLPKHEAEFIHRNGRTARMNKDGVAYVLHWKEEVMPEFITIAGEEAIMTSKPISKNHRHTLLVSGGRKDKISKGDIAGLFFKKGMLEKDQLGVIELKTDCAFVGVEYKDIDVLIGKLNNERIKKRKVRVTLI